jgi:hypothetical protein
MEWIAAIEVAVGNSANSHLHTDFVEGTLVLALFGVVAGRWLGAEGG